VCVCVCVCVHVASLDVARAFDSIPITPLWQVGGGALQRREKGANS
jgi:hypothetical protein